jgi:hypothetical protein
MSRPIDELQQLLKNLHLRRMAEGLPEELQRAEKCHGRWWRSRSGRWTSHHCVKRLLGTAARGRRECGW